MLVRLGVNFLWIGVESKKEIYEKNKGADFVKLVSDLRHRGITVLTSAILFLEEHDHTTIWDDIDFAISLKPDYLQFMELGPIPGTALYADYDRKGILCEEVPYEDQHGQDMIWFRHPHFTREESGDYLRRAFQKDYEVNGASMMRAMRTTLWGYEHARNHANVHIRARAKTFLDLLEQMRHFTLAARVFNKNRETARLTREVAAEFRKLFGRFDPLSLGALALAGKAKIRQWTHTDTRQPETLYIKAEAKPDKTRRQRATAGKPFVWPKQGPANAS